MNNMAPAFLFLPETIRALQRVAPASWPPPWPARAGTLQSPHSPPSAAVEELPLKSRPAAGRLRSADLFPSSGYLLAPSFAEGCWRRPERPTPATLRVAETIAPANPRGVFQAKEPFMAGKEQKRGNKESKKPKQKPVAVVAPVAPAKAGGAPPPRAGKKG
jgi:hypothetical protein